MTLNSPVSSHDDAPLVVDTVVLLYFTLAGELELLGALAPHGLVTTSVVFDPGESTASEDARSEIGRSRHFYEQLSSDPRAPVEEQQRAKLAVQRLSAVDILYQAEQLLVVTLSETELALFASLASTTSARAAGLRRALHPGEASCLAVAVTRSWVLATDDTDALKALAELAPQSGYERIRKLLVRAAEEGQVSETRANDIHSEIRGWGFWDNTPPFP